MQKFALWNNLLRLLPVRPAPTTRAGPEGLHSQPVLHNAPYPRRGWARLRRAATRLVGVLVVGFDTATPVVSVALHDGERVVSEAAAADGRRHGELLAPMIAQVLAGAGASLSLIHI